MSTDPRGRGESPPDRRRESIRRELVRASRAAFAVFALAVTLAVAAIVQATRADRSAAAAERAAADLRRNLPAQLRGDRDRRVVGWRRDHLAALAGAARVGPSLPLRNEAVATLAYPDFRPETAWPAPPESRRDPVFAPSLERYAAAGTRGGITVYALSDNREIVHLPGGEGPFDVLAFDPSATLLAGRDVAENLVLFDLVSGAERWRRALGIDRHRRGALAFSPGGEVVAAGNVAGGVTVFDTGDGQVRARLEGAPWVYGLDFAPGGGRLAAAAERELVIWDWESGGGVSRYPHPEIVNTVAWHPRGHAVATGSNDRHVHLWDLRSGASRRLVNHTRAVTHVAFDPRGDTLVSSANDGLNRWFEFSSGRLLGKTHQGRITRFSPDGEWVAYHRSGDGLGVWRVDSPPVYRAFHCPGGPELRLRSVAVDVAGELVAAVNADGLRVWALGTGELLYSEEQAGIMNAVFHPGGHLLLAGGPGGVRAWPITRPAGPGPGGGDALDSPPTPALGSPRRLPHFGLGVGDIALAGETDLLLARAFDRAVLAPLEDTGGAVTFAGQARMNHVAVSSDGGRVAISTWVGEGTVLWDGGGGERLRHLGRHSASVAFSPDGRLLAVSDKEGTAVWADDGGRALFRVPRDAIGETPSPVAFSADGAMLALCTARHLVRLVAAGTGEELATLRAPDDALEVTALAFGGGGRVLAAATGSAQVQLWDLAGLCRQLAALGLDWDPRGGPAPPAAATAGTGTRSLPVLAALGSVAAAALLALFTWRRHRRFLDGYLEIDQLVDERGRALAQAQTEVLHSQKMTALGTLAAGMAHDFNNILSVIRMANQLTGERAADDPEVAENAELVEKSVAQGKGIVRSILGYSRGPAETVDYDVAEVVEASVGLLSQEFLGGVELKLELDRGAPLVHGSPNRLEQVVLNLVVNAAEAMEGKGTLRISVRPVEPGLPDYLLRPGAAHSLVELEVADSGPGIEPGDRARVFEPFFTTKAAGASHGTGLGLSTVYTIAQGEGFGLSLESAPGGGTRFRLHLPARGQGTARDGQRERHAG